MDKREAQEVVNETVSGLVGGYIIALMVIAALPFVGWALLFGLAGAIAAPGAAALVVVGLVVWGWVSSKRRDARWARERAAVEAKRNKLKEPHGGKDRYFVREGYTIKLMRFYHNKYDCADLGGYGWAGEYTLRVTDDAPYTDAYYSSANACRINREMWNDPKRLERWQAVFEDWIETGVQPSQQTWWMFPDEVAQYTEREAERQRMLKMAICPENSLTHGLRFA